MHICDQLIFNLSQDSDFLFFKYHMSFLQTSQNFLCTLTVDVAWSFSDDSAQFTSDFVDDNMGGVVEVGTG